MKPPTPRDLLLVPIAGLLLAWLLLLRPDFLAGPASYVIVSGDSMEPTLHDGDLAITRSQGGYAIGDIVAFHVPEGEPGEGAIVIHRIVGGSPDEGFVMQGDNKEGPDSWQPKENLIVGKMWFRLPGAGRWLAVLRAPAVMAAGAAGVAVFLVLSGGETKRPRPEKPVAARPARSLARAARWLRLPSWLGFLIVLAFAVGLLGAVAFSARH